MYSIFLVLALEGKLSTAVDEIRHKANIIKKSRTGEIGRNRKPSTQITGKR